MSGSRTFVRREVDETGISGTGDVADGVVFPDGVAVLHWRGKLASTAVYETVEMLQAIHGHGGKTVIAWGAR